MVEHEINLLNQLKNTGLEFSCPVAMADGEYIHKIDGNECVLFEYIEGQFLKKVSISAARSAAKLLAQFHQISSSINIDISLKFSQNYIYELWIKNATEFIKQGKMQVYSLQELEDLKLKLKTLKEKESFLHGDVAPKNFIYADKKCYLFDFEQLSQGLRIFDLIDGMIEFSMQNNSCQTEIAAAFYTAYNNEYPLLEQSKERFNSTLEIQIMAKITRLYRTHLVFNYDLNEQQINGLKDCYKQLAITCSKSQDKQDF